MLHTVNRPQTIATLKKHEGKWVALTQDEKTVLCSGDTIDEVLEVARGKGELSPFLIRIPDATAATFVF